jgi:hypothetical protein
LAPSWWRGGREGSQSEGGHDRGGVRQGEVKAEGEVEVEVEAEVGEGVVVVVVVGIVLEHDDRREGRRSVGWRRRSRAPLVRLPS